MCLKQYQEAIHFYDKAIELNPNYTIAYCNKSTALNNKKYHDYEKANDYFNKGIETIDLNKKIEYYDKSIELNPNYTVVYSYKGNALYSLKNYEQAIDCFNKAIEINPKFSEAYNNKGFALFNLNRCDEAIECYNKAIEMSPNDFDLFVSKGIFKMLYLIFIPY